MPTKRERGRPRHDDTLTPAEWRIVEAVRHGMTSRMIAQRRGISIDAVKFHVANALSKLDLANRAELRRWNGVSRSTLLYGKDPDMATASPIGRIGQISRTVTDLKAAETWYRDVLGLTHLYTFGDLAFFDCAGTRLFLSYSEGTAQHESILYFQVADIRASHTDLAARGATFINAPHMTHRHANGTEEWLATFEDNEGRPLAIMAQVAPSE
jgi:DNA-binding CsgD family transcriptional regulator/catechol 2,3-dioxygenase-like lactoylglutathione lyase family enzyme